MSEVMTTGRRDHLLVGSIGYHAPGWWGILLGILTEAALFSYLLFSYYYFAIQPHAGPWPPDGLPSLRFALPDTIILIVSSGTVWLGEYGTKRGMRWLQLVGLAVTVVLGLAFIGIELLEWHDKKFALASGPYASLFFTITGFHLAHVVVGVIVIVMLTVWSAMGYFGPIRHSHVSIGAAYWHFVDAVWIAVFFTFYITPHLS
jgi:cytochrome c oxidase subunit 3